MSGTETGITVQPAPLARLIVSGFPASPTAGTANNFTVTATDAYGNVITGYLGTVNLSSTDSNASFSPASYTFTGADAGTHTFSATLVTAGLQSIKATDATNNVSGTETGVTVQPASFAKLILSGFPASPTAGTAYNFTVRSTDAYGNVVTGYLGTVNLSSTDSNASLSPASYTFTAGDAGTHTFSATLVTAGIQSITVTDATNNLSDTETAITVQPAAARTFTATGFPTNAVAGTAYNVAVTALDAYDNVAAGYTGTVAFSSSDGHAVLPASYKFTAADAGTHSFSVTLETAGTQSITVTDTVTPSIKASEGNIDVQAAAATTLKIAGFPATETAGAASQVTVTAYDAFGNLATAYVGTVAFSSSDGQAVLPNDYTFMGSDAGSHTFSLTLETAGTQSITATDTATSSITGSESNITVKAAAARTLSVTGFPATDAAGVAANVVVTARDAFGNVATGYTGTVAFSSSDSRAVFPGDFTFNGADAGTRTFSLTLATAGTQSITVTDSNTPSIVGSESNIVVRAAAAKTLTAAGFPATTTAGTANDVVVTAYDIYGNVATGYVGTVTLSSTDEQAVLPANFTFTTLDAGSHSFPVTLETAGTQSITVRDTAAPTLSASDTAISVQAAAARSLAVAGFPATETAGVAAQITVSAYDAFGNLATGYMGTVAVSSSDGQAVLPAHYTFTGSDAGTHTFSLTLETAGTQSITATDKATTSITGSESNITVKAAAARTLTVTGFPSTDTAGVAENVVVTALDAFGNVATSYAGKVAFSSSDGQAVFPTTYTFRGTDAGTHTFSVTLETAGTQSITIADTNTPSITGSESNIPVDAAAATRLAVTGFPATTTAGAANDVVVTAYDPYGNVATGYAGTVALSSPDGQAVLPANFTFTALDAGSHSFSVSLETAGTTSLTANDVVATSVAGSESGITVKPAAAHSLAVTGFPSADTAGNSRAVTVTAYDAYGNVATGYTGTVGLTSSDAHAMLPAKYTFTSGDKGIHTLSVALDSAGMQSISASDVSNASVSGVQSGIVVSAASASVLVLTGYPSTAAGAIEEFTVTARDPYGNTATGYTGTIRFESSDPQATAGAGLPLDYNFTNGAGKDNGAHVFSAALKTAGTQSLTAQDTESSTIKGTETGISVSAAGATHLVFDQQPSSVTAGVAIAPAPSVLIEDAYGNVVTGDNSVVTLTLSGGTFDGGSNTTTAHAASGVATFSGLKIDVSGTDSVSATDGSLAATGASETFAIHPAAAARLVIHIQPSPTAIAGQAFAIQPQVYEEDQFGNLETVDSSTAVTAALSAGTGPLVGTKTATVSGGIATFANLAENTAGTISLDLTGGILQPAFTNAIDITAGPATQLVMTTPPPVPLAAGQAFTLAVSAEDSYGNVDQTFNRNVTISFPNDPSFTATVQAQNGVATFVNLVIGQSAAGETIQATANGLRAGVTSPLEIPPAPTIIREQVVTSQKTNKKGKKIGKPVFVGFALTYSEPMNSSSAGLAANYQVDTTIKKRVKKKLVTVLKPVLFRAAYNTSTDTVTLTVKGKPNFAKGGQIVITASAPSGVASAVGELLETSDTHFTISPKAKAVQGPT